MPASKNTIIFDLDGTLLNGDSTTVWMIQSMLKSPIRIILGVLLAPVVLPLVLIPPLRRFNGGSIMLWIATFGWSQAKLQVSFAEFADLVQRKEIKLRWKEKGIEQLEAHQEQKNSVIIATAAPEWLAISLFKAIDCDIEIVGSSLKRIMGGWVATQHCFNKKKCAMLHNRGFGLYWDIAYSDSTDDLPLLLLASTPVLVNCSNTKKRDKILTQILTLKEVNW